MSVIVKDQLAHDLMHYDSSVVVLVERMESTLESEAYRKVYTLLESGDWRQATSMLKEIGGLGYYLGIELSIKTPYGLDR